MLIVETYLSESKGKGVGIFTKNLIPKDTVWWIRDLHFDKLITPEEFNLHTALAKQFIKDYGFLEATGNWHLCIDNARFSNHSDKPNTLNNWNEKGELISCIALKDIDADEEILCDYKEICVTCKESLGFENKE
jgi:hypothetical protein